MSDLANLLNRHILHSISEIEFDNLSILNLSGNNIESVEVFHRIRMPQIQNIRIENDFRAVHLNYVADLSQLRKICFPDFKEIVICMS